jgi:dephospho-CoA kinase
MLGLTGGIGSGKSTVDALLEAKGAVVLDADAMVKQLQQPGMPVFDAMVERFGPGIVGEDGALDRAAVAEIVFNDPDALKDLNGIVHPAVGERINQRLTELAETDEVVVLDIPLLVEGNREGYAGVLVVDTDPEVALRRLVEQRGFTEEDARARMANQASREDRLARADVVIRNDGTLAELQAEVDRAWEWIEAKRAA